MSITFNLHTTGEEDDTSSVTYVSNGALITVPDTHPNFKRVVHALVEGNDPTEFIDAATALGQFSDRVTVNEHEVLFDGEEIANAITRTILRYRNEGRDTQNLVRFLERVQANPSRHSREQLWGWIENADLHVAEDGRIVAWKSVEVVEGEPVYAEHATDEDGDPVVLGTSVETYRSHSSGTAWVNGVEFNGQIPYAVGDIITIPRELVEDNPAVACSHGLHIGSFDYASSFGGSRSKILEVAVAPEDVVSVPHDSSQQKIRCARFEVLAVQERPQEDLSHYEPEGEPWDDSTAEDDILATIDDEVDRTFVGRLLERFRKGEA